MLFLVLKQIKQNCQQIYTSLSKETDAEVTIMETRYKECYVPAPNSSTTENLRSRTSSLVSGEASNGAVQF